MNAAPTTQPSWKESFVQQNVQRNDGQRRVNIPRLSIGPTECPACALASGGLHKLLAMRWGHKHRGWSDCRRSAEPVYTTVYTGFTLYDIIPWCSTGGAAAGLAKEFLPPGTDWAQQPSAAAARATSCS